ncbi:MAG: glycosyltransferase [Sulfurimonadaceae bacterium]
MINKTEHEIMQNWKGNLDKPVLSVCCTTYNHAPYIAEAIDGFLMQETDFPFEILIRDDCSTDKTAEIVKQYADQYPQLIKPVYEKENTFSKGVKPMPVLYKKALGKYIALCEGDDYWTDHFKLQAQVDFLEENDEYVITYTSVEAFDENGIVKDYVGGATRDLEKDELQRTTPINTLTTCFRNVIGEVPKEFQCTQYGDLFIWSLLGAHGKGKFLADISPSRYRIHEGGIHSKKTDEIRLEMWSLSCAALYLYHARVGNKELAEHFKKYIFGPDIFKIMLEKISTKKLIKLTLKIIRHRIRQKVKNFFRMS